MLVRSDEKQVGNGSRKRELSMAITIKILGEIKNGKVIPPPSTGGNGHVRKPKNGPVTRPVYIADEQSRKAFAIANQIAGLRRQVLALEQEYRKLSGTHSDPSVDLRQLVFPFAVKHFTVHGL